MYAVYARTSTYRVKSIPLVTTHQCCSRDRARTLLEARRRRRRIHLHVDGLIHLRQLSVCVRMGVSSSFLLTRVDDCYCCCCCCCCCREQLLTTRTRTTKTTVGRRKGCNAEQQFADRATNLDSIQQAEYSRAKCLSAIFLIHFCSPFRRFVARRK